MQSKNEFIIDFKGKSVKISNKESIAKSSEVVKLYCKYSTTPNKVRIPMDLTPEIETVIRICAGEEVEMKRDEIFKYILAAEQLKCNRLLRLLRGQVSKYYTTSELYFEFIKEIEEGKVSESIIEEVAVNLNEFIERDSLHFVPSRYIYKILSNKYAKFVPSQNVNNFIRDYLRENEEDLINLIPVVRDNDFKKELIEKASKKHPGILPVEEKSEAPAKAEEKEMLKKEVVDEHAKAFEGARKKNKEDIKEYIKNIKEYRNELKNDGKDFSVQEENIKEIEDVLDFLLY